MRSRGRIGWSVRGPDNQYRARRVMEHRVRGRAQTSTKDAAGMGAYDHGAGTAGSVQQCPGNGSPGEHPGPDIEGR